MFNVSVYMQSMLELLQKNFDKRLLYIGLQGSYLREEATEASDIDIVVILDDLAPADLTTYKNIVHSLDMPEKSCGFICGRNELVGWNTLEVCNFLCGTKDFYGRLSDYLPTYTTGDVVQFIKVSVGNLYHEIVHRYVHADEIVNRNGLPYSYKNVFFVLQSIYYLKDGVFYLTKRELTEHLSVSDRAVMEMDARLSKDDNYNFDEAFSLLLAWCQEILHTF